MNKINNLSFWKVLANFWSFFTLIFFIGSYLNYSNFHNVLGSVAVIYASILAIYVGSKEIARWKNRNFMSQYYGELFIIAWTMVMVGFIIGSVVNPGHIIPSEFTATYITVMGIFAISQKSKALKG